MPAQKGYFVWCELTTTDVASAVDFYRSVVGWDAQDPGLPGIQYMVLNTGGVGVGGIMQLPEAACAAGARPGWMGYIGVDDVDAVVAQVSAAGGSIHRPADDIPGVGRFAIAADPQGALFCLFKPFGGEPPPPAANTPGRFGWHELHTADLEAGFTFYADLFGWTKKDAVDMGPMGIYQTFATGGPSGDNAVGGMMKKTDEFPASAWIYYANVADTAAAAARVKQAGGQVINGPHQVPGGNWIAHCLDPQGAMFAVVGPTATG